MQLQIEVPARIRVYTYPFFSDRNNQDDQSRETDLDTGFFFGGGIAFLLALLGWADQIRGAQEKTRLAEQQFRERYKFQWSELQPLIRPEGGDDAESRLNSILAILFRDKKAFRRSIDIVLLTKIEGMNSIRNRLESQYAERFLLVYFITVELFTAGVLSIGVRGRTSICQSELTSLDQPNRMLESFWCYDWNQIMTSIWLILVAIVLILTWSINKGEVKLRSSLVDIDDQLREVAEDEDGSQN